MTGDQEFPYQDRGSQGVTTIGFASPWDRLAAFVVDCTLLLPFVQLLQAPIKKWTLEAFLFYEGANTPLFELLNLMIFVSLFFAYFSLSTYFKGQTLGQAFFRIQVISYHGKIGFLTACLRSLFMIVQFFLLAIPYLAVFTQPQRRPLHDRVADTLVIGLNGAVGFPEKNEKHKGQTLALALSLVFIFLLSSFLLDRTEPSKDLTLFNNQVCEQKAVEVDHSLVSLLELFMVQALHQECLYQKARESLWAQENTSLAQFAMAVALEFNPEQSDKYLKMICTENPDDNLCEFSQWLQLHDKKDKISKLEKILKKNNQEDFIKIYGATFYRSLGFYSKVELLLMEIESIEQLESLFVSLRLQSLLGQGKWSQADWLIRSHKILGIEDVLSFSKREFTEKFISHSQQIELLEFFFPQLKEKASGRGLASSVSVNSQVLSLYKQLKEAQ